MTNNLSVSPRSRPEVGSSRIRNGGSVVSARAISTICRSSKARLRTDASRRIRRPRRSSTLSAEASSGDGRRRSGSPARGQARYFVRHRGPGPASYPGRPSQSILILRVAPGLANWTGFSSSRISPAVGRKKHRRDAHEGGLAGAVLADKPMDLAAMDVERRPLQRLNAREAFLNSDDAKRRSGIAHVERLSVKDLGQFGVRQIGVDEHAIGKIAFNVLAAVGVVDQRRLDDLLLPGRPRPPEA